MPRCAKHDVLPFFYASIIMDKAGVIIATHGEEGGELDLPGFRFQGSAAELHGACVGARGRKGCRDIPVSMLL
jgi:hypothetical protein